MTVHATSQQFKENAHRALRRHEPAAGALGHVRSAFIAKRASAVAALPEFDALRDGARDIKDHTLKHLDLYIEAYEAQVSAAGGTVHFARDAGEATKIIIDLCKSHGARTITKGKSMVSEEIALNAVIEAAGLVPIETRPRRVTSCRSAARCRATSSRPPSTSRASRSRPISGGSTPTCPTSANSPTPCSS